MIEIRMGLMQTEAMMTCAYVHTYIHTYIHTYTHTYNQDSREILMDLMQTEAELKDKIDACEKEEEHVSNSYMYAYVNFFVWRTR